MNMNMNNPWLNQYLQNMMQQNMMQQNMMQQNMIPNAMNQNMSDQQNQQAQQPRFGQQAQQQGLYGRYINRPEEIVASEVPMDGSIGYFPAADQKTIYAKAWTADGRIETGIYKLVESEKAKEEAPERKMMDMLNARFDSLEQMIAKTTHSPSKKKGEVVADET